MKTASRTLGPVNVAALPRPDALIQRFRIAAVLEVCVQPDRNWRVFTLRQTWRPGICLGVMDIRQGSCFYAIFEHNGVLIKGYDDESPVVDDHPDPPARQKLFKGTIPHQYEQYYADEETDPGGCTFVVWWNWMTNAWQVPSILLSPQLASIPMGALSLLTWRSEWSAWITEYYEIEKAIADEVTSQLEAGHPLSKGMLSRLYVTGDKGAILREVRRLGYPVAE